MQSYIDRSLCRAIVGSHGVHVFMYLLDSERVGKLRQVEQPEELGYALDAFAEVGRHRRFTVAYKPVILYLHLHIGGCGAARFGQIERVTQL